jgi:hypothetical protein
MPNDRSPRGDRYENLKFYIATTMYIRSVERPARGPCKAREFIWSGPAKATQAGLEIQ